MRSSLFNAILLLLIIISVFLIVSKRSNRNLNEIPLKTLDRLKPKIEEAENYAIDHKLNTDFAVLIDAKIHSGKYRMFVIDLKSDSILKKGLVAHGCGKLPWGRDWSKKKAKFSNEPNSHLSSLGKYKIGKRGYSNWGIHVNYKLHGLDSTNNNALDRLIVLHSWEAVKDNPIYPKGTSEGWGCPAVSNKMMHYLDSTLKTQAKPSLFWIYD